MNELIQIPEFSYDTVNIIVNIKTFIDGVQRGNCEGSHSIIRLIDNRNLNNKISVLATH